MRKSKRLMLRRKTFSLVLFQQILDSFRAGKQVGDRLVLIAESDDISDIFAHLAAYIPFSVKQLFRLIYKVRGKDLAYYALVIALIKVRSISVLRT